MKQPPIIWEWILRIAIHGNEEQYVLGDLEETFNLVAIDYGGRRARSWYRRQVLLSLLTFLIRSAKWNLIMINNYLKIALRNLRKSFGYTSINITGLAVGLACTMTIGLFAMSELTFDTHHDNVDRIVRLIKTSRFGDGEDISPVTSGPYGPMLTEALPELADFFRLRQRRSGTEVVSGEAVYYEADIYDADASILQILSVRPASAFSAEPLEVAFHALISESTARRMFNRIDLNGQNIEIDGSQYTIDGVYEDFPLNSHFRPSIIGSFATLEQTMAGTLAHPGNNFLYTYFLLESEGSEGAAEQKINTALETYVGPAIAAKLDFALQPLKSIHLKSHYEDELEPNGSMESLLIVSAIGLFILILAVVNFINLSTARSARRAREVGVRKAVGAHRRQIAGQFLSETVLLSYLALGAAAVLVYSFSNTFEVISGRELDLSLITQPAILALIIVFSGCVGMVAGLYPALVISSFRPVRVLKGGSQAASDTGSQLLKKGLVVLQFSISIVLIISTLLVGRQLTFMKSASLGFNSDQILVTRLRNDQARDAAKELIDRTRRDISVLGVTSASTLLGDGPGSILFIPEGIERGEDGIAMATMHVDFDFTSTMDIAVLSGRSFDSDRPADITESFVINAQAANRMGWSVEEAIGKQLIWPTTLDGSRPPARVGQIIGVVDDFNFTSLHHTVTPLVLALNEGRPRYIMTRIESSMIPATLARLRDSRSEIVQLSGLESFFLNDHFDRLYAAEERFGKMFRFFRFSRSHWPVWDCWDLSPTQLNGGHVKSEYAKFLELTLVR